MRNSRKQYYPIEVAYYHFIFYKVALMKKKNSFTYVPNHLLSMFEKYFIHPLKSMVLNLGGTELYHFHMGINRTHMQKMNHASTSVFKSSLETPIMHLSISFTVYLCLFKNSLIKIHHSHLLLINKAKNYTFNNFNFR